MTTDLHRPTSIARVRVLRLLIIAVVLYNLITPVMVAISGAYFAWGVANADGMGSIALPIALFVGYAMYGGALVTSLVVSVICLAVAFVLSAFLRQAVTPTPEPQATRYPVV